jgi:hypothetical protein
MKAVNEPHGYTFQILVPFSSFPPLPSVSIDKLRIMVDVFSPARAGRKTGAYSTSSAARVYGNPATFNTVKLDEPVEYHLSPCKLPLSGINHRGELSMSGPSESGAYADPAWFVPSTNPAGGYESETFMAINDSNREGPDGLSPAIRLTHFFWKNTGPDEWVCGPALSYRKGSDIQNYPYTVLETGFDVKRIPEGDLLIKTGPRVYNWAGNSQCGACPWTEMKIFDLRSDRKMFGALSLEYQINGNDLASQDFSISPDWSRVVQFDLVPDGSFEHPSWTSTTYCLVTDTERYQTRVHRYAECGKKNNVEPPNPPLLKELRDQQQ